MVALGEDLLLAGAFGDVAVVTRSLRDGADDEKRMASEACRAALSALGESAALKGAATLIGDLDYKMHATFVECCVAIGPAAVEALRPALESEHETVAFIRARGIVRKYGAGAIAGIVGLLESREWFVLRNAAVLLGATRSADAVAPLQSLLRRNDPRVLRPAVTALAGIDDPSAARALQTVLRSATGANRAAVVAALAAERDPRVVPMLIRILGESDPFGADHQTLLDTLDAEGGLGAGAPRDRHAAGTAGARGRRTDGRPAAEADHPNQPRTLPLIPSRALAWSAQCLSGALRAPGLMRYNKRYTLPMVTRITDS
jgi:hypothetical protein